MQCYSLHNDIDTGYRFELAPGEKIVRGNYKTGLKASAFVDTAFDTNWRFTDSTRQVLPKMNMLINMDGLDLPDIMGSCAAVPLRDETQGPIAISERFRIALAEVMGKALDLVPAGALIDQLSGNKILDHGFMFLSVAEERDTYDRSTGKYSEFKRSDGRVIRSARPITTHKSNLISDCVIWREAYDGALRCTDRFKAIYDEIDGRGLQFQPHMT